MNFQTQTNGLINLMDKEQLLTLNAVPEGKEAWLNYQTYCTLQALFEQVDTPTSETEALSEAYLKLYTFLTQKADIRPAKTAPAIHFNAFTLLRRGYKVEEITAAEYQTLQALMTEAAEADLADMDLYAFGHHRDLYNYLRQKMGLFVEAGRGPVWHRAKVLLEKYETATRPEGANRE
jgi:hypothetical protein